MPDAHIANTAAGPIQKVVLADKDSGEPINPGTGGAGGGTGDASAANQTTQIARATDANTKLDALLSAAIKDSAGTPFNPESCSIAYGYDGSGNLVTETATLGAVVRVKTTTWVAGRVTAESQWVVQ